MADIPGRHKKRGRHFRAEWPETTDSRVALLSCQPLYPVHTQGVAGQLPKLLSVLSSRLLINGGAPVSVQNTMVDSRSDTNPGKATWNQVVESLL